MQWRQTVKAPGSGVFQSPFRKAEILYQSLALPQRPNAYLHVTDRDSTHQQATQRIAECYLHLDMVDEAATWYGAAGRHHRYLIMYINMPSC